MKAPPLLFIELLQELKTSDLECLGGWLRNQRENGKNIRLGLLIVSALYYLRTRTWLTFKTDARYLVYAPPCWLPIYRSDELEEIWKRMSRQSKGLDYWLIYDVWLGKWMQGGELE